MTRSALVRSWRSDRARTRIFEFTRQLSFLGSGVGPVVRPEAPSLPSPASGGGGACGAVTGSILQPINPPIIFVLLGRRPIWRGQMPRFTPHGRSASLSRSQAKDGTSQGQAYRTRVLHPVAIGSP